MAKKESRKKKKKSKQKTGIKGPCFKMTIKTPSFEPRIDPIRVTKKRGFILKKEVSLYRRLRLTAFKIASQKLKTHGRFSKDDLIGKTIADHVRVGYPEIFHPEGQSPNPANLDVTVYSDMTFQMLMRWGDGECAHTERYYFDGRNYFHTDDPYD